MLRTITILAGAGLLAWGCASVTASSDQCKVDSDCESILGLAAGKVTCEVGQCNRKNDIIQPATEDAGATVAVCTSTAQCETDLGSPALCLKPGVDPCVKLTSPECPEVTPNYKKGNPVFVGVMIPNTFLVDGSEVDSSYDQTVTNGAKLAFEEWDAQTGGGIATGAARRPIVGIFCNTKSDAATRDAAYDHLSKRVGVQAVVVRNTNEASALVPRTTTDGRLLYCTDCIPEATAAGVATKGLVWHQAPSPLLDVPVRADWVKRVERRIRAQRALAPTAQLKVVFVNITDTGYPEWAAASIAALRVNEKTATENGANFVRITRTSADTDAFGFAREIVGHRPDIIIGMGFGAYWHTQAMPAIEAYWPSDKPRPNYVMASDEAANASRWRYSVGTNEGLRKRLQGTWLADEAIEYDAIDAFQANYAAKFAGADAQYISNGYDAINALSYAIAGAVSSATTVQDTLNGGDIARQFARLVPGTDAGVERPRTQFVPSGIANGVAALALGKGLDLQACLGNLDWNPATGYILANAETYCGAFSSRRGHVAPTDTGLVYATRIGKMVSNDDGRELTSLGDEDVYPECF